MEPKRRLGLQLTYRSGRTRRSEFKLQNLLDKIWDEATAWVSTQEAPATRKELLLRARPALTWARAKLEDPDAALSTADRAVLSYACDEIERRSLEKVTLPWRQVRDDTGLGERTVKSSLARLIDKRHLMVVTPGRSGTSGKRKATIYRLPVPIPVNGSMGPPAKFYGTPPQDITGTPSSATDTAGGRS